MKKIAQLILFLGCFSYATAQSRIVINNNAYLVISNSGYVVIDNGNSNALTTLGTGGNIISEGELNNVKWNISTNTGTYVIPFTTDPSGTNTKIPFTINITGAGVAAGHFLFSTFETTNDNNTSYPSDVTHMGSPNNSLYTVDRFWIIDGESYTTLPSATLSFGYDDAVNEIGISNTISEANLQAQVFAPAPTLAWGGSGFGTANTATNIVSGVNVVDSYFHRSWTLVDNSNPLPIELQYFTAKEERGRVKTSWTTFTEINNDYFSVLRSKDGIDFEEIGTIGGAGTSNSINDYFFYDDNPYPGLSYYRLKQTDFNSESTLSQIEVINMDGMDIVTIYPNPANEQASVLLSSSTDSFVTYNIISDIGQIISTNSVNIHKGTNLININTSELAKGIYMFKLTTSNGELVFKNFIKN